MLENLIYFIASSAITNYTTSFVWGGILLLAIIIEIATFSIVSIWFMPGAAIALGLSFIPGFPIWAEIIIFVVVSLVFFLLLRRSFRATSNNEKSTNADVVIGQLGIITEDVDNIEGKGAVKVQGKIWSARADEIGASLKIGDYVEILRIEGVKLICKKHTTNN